MNKKIINNNIAIECGLLSLFFVCFCFYERYKYGYNTSARLLFIPIFVILLLGYLHKISVIELNKTNYNNKFIYFFRVILYFLIAIRLIGVGWGTGYLTPLFEAQFQSGFAHMDTLFHSAVSNMIFNYKTASIGVEGLSYLPYHFLSHILIGGVGRILGYGAWESYHLIFIPLFYPLMIGSIQILSNKISEIWELDTSNIFSNIVPLLMILIMITGIIPEDWRKNLAIYNSSLISESYFIGIVLLYVVSTLTLSIFYGKNKNNLYFYFFLFFTTIVLSTSKISVGIIFFSFWLFYTLLNKLNKTNLACLISSGSGVLIASLFAYRKRELISTTNGISLFHFEKSLVNPLFWTWYIFLYYFLVMFVITLIDIKKKGSNKEKSYWDKVIFIILMIMCTGALPGFLIKSAGSNAAYFSDIIKWICLPIGISLSSHLLNDYIDFKKLIHLYKGSVIVILVIVTCSAFSIKNNLDISYNNYANSILLYTSYSDYEVLYNSLANLKKSAGKNNIATFNMVPSYGREDISDKRTYMRSFLSVPAISGIPLINEVEEYLIAAKGPYNYGFDKLMKQRVKSENKYNVIEIDY